MILTFLPKKSQLSVLLAQVFYVTGKNPTASQYRACFQVLTVSLYNHFNRREGIRVSGLLLRSIHVLRVYFGSLKTSCVKYSVSLLIAVNVLKRMCDAQMKVAWRLPELIETHLDTEWKGWHFTQVFQIRFRCLSRACEICKLD